MKRKKLIGIALAMSLIVSSTACGSSSAPEADTASQEKEAQEAEKESAGASGDEAEEETASEESADDAAGEDAEGASQADNASDSQETASSSVDIPEFMYTTEYIYDTDDSDRFDQTLCEGRIETIMLTEASKQAYPELDSAFSGFINDRVKEARDLRTDYSDSNKEYRDSISADETDPFIYSAWVYLENYVRRVDSKCLSLLSSLDTFAGGAHGYQGFTSINFDVATGKEIPLSDVVGDEQGFTDAIVKALIDGYGEDSFFYDGYSSLADMIAVNVKNTMHPDQAVADEDGSAAHFEWTLDAEGLTVLFNAYDIAAYAMGTITTMIPYSSGLINADYIPADDCSIITGLPKYMTVYTDTNGDGATESYDFWDIADEYNAGDSDGFVVRGANGEKKVEDYFSGFKAYLVRAEGSHFIMTDLQGMSDWHNISTFKLEDGNVGDAVTIDADAPGGYYDEAAGEYYNICATNSKAIYLGKRFDILSTYEGYKTFSVKADGNVDSDNPYYNISVEYVLTSVKPIDCEIVDMAGNVQGKETIPEGTHFTFVRTDGESTVDLKIDDGRIVRIALEKDTENWGYMIDGVNAEEFFEQLYFAG